MRFGVCGVACEKCPRLAKGQCPNGETGCTPRRNPVCRICNCGYEKGVRVCFECPDFPCELTKQGPLAYGFCQYLAGIDPETA